MDKRRWPAIMVIVGLVMLFPTTSCQPPDNYAPVINSLEADAEWTLPSGSINVTCNASDRDGDALGYDWSAGGGTIAGTGDRIIWTAPQDVGVYDITVVVEDGQGGNKTGTLSLIAATGTLPMIESLTVTADHKYLKETTTGYKVGKGQEYHIECAASSNVSEELVYEWICTDGEFSGEGPIITWTAPYTSNVVTVTAVVFDVEGNMDKGSVLLTVVVCTSCEF